MLNLPRMGPTIHKQNKRLIFTNTVGTSVSIVSDYRVGDLGSIPVRSKTKFPPASVSIPSLRPTEPPVHWVPGCIAGGKAQPGRALPPGKGPSGIHYTGGWVGLRVYLFTVARGNILCLCRGSISVRPVCSQTLH
jgi:hypothetical protein